MRLIRKYYLLTASLFTPQGHLNLEGNVKKASQQNAKLTPSGYTHITLLDGFKN